jgi:uncharacterized protein YkwD
MISIGRRCGTLVVGLAGSGLLLFPGTPPLNPSTVSGPAAPIDTVTLDTVPVVSSTPSPSEQRKAVVTATNAERAKAGCAALATKSALGNVAQAHATDMAARKYFSHTSKDGRTFADRLGGSGLSFRTGGENIARGQRNAAEVVAAWMSSDGHRRNILNCAFTAIGVGYDVRGNYWVQDFIG